MCALTDGEEILSHWFDTPTCTQEIIADLKNDASQMCETITMGQLSN